MKILNILRSKSKGFTLIELLVVIAIIGILAAVVLVSLNSARAKSRDAKRLADVRQVMTAAELFFNDNNSYPDDDATGLTPVMTDGSPAFNTLLSQWPTTPLPADGTCTTAENTYTYVGQASDCSTGDLVDPSCYALTFCLGAPTGGLGASGDPAVTCTASPKGLVCT